jgi:hypothetical protein
MITALGQPRVLRYEPRRALKGRIAKGRRAQGPARNDSNPERSEDLPHMFLPLSFGSPILELCHPHTSTVRHPVKKNFGKNRNTHLCRLGGK